MADGCAWLIRHGESISNAGQKGDAPGTARITERGLDQARAVARAFEQPPRLVVVSPYIRTKQTAGPTLERFPDSPVEEWPVHEFTYLCPADYAGTTARERRPWVDEYWAACDPDYRDGGGAESFADFLGRVRDMLDRLASLPGLTAVFAHGHVIRAGLWLMLSGVSRATPEAMAMYRAFRDGLIIPNCAVIRLRLTGPGSPSLSSLITGHLPRELLTPAWLGPLL